MTGGIWAVIPARGGSKGIPRKNLAELGGRPLLHWVVNAALGANLLDGVLVSTDDDEIARFALGCGAEVHRRSSRSSSDTASTEDAVREVLSDRVDIGTVVLVQATSPMTESTDIDRAVIMWRESGRASVVSVTRQRMFRWADAGMALNYDPHLRPRRQEWPGELFENGALYVSQRDAYVVDDCRCPNPAALLEMEAWKAHEVDTRHDIVVVEALLMWRQRVLLEGRDG